MKPGRTKLEISEGRLKLRVMESRTPVLTRRFDLAFHFASGLHHKQVRKGTGIPYIAHLMSVCALVLEAGADEDQGGLPTLNTIKRLFGDRVENIVRECSDSESPDPNHKLPWHQRKRAYLERLGAASPVALLVSAADKLHNARDITRATSWLAIGRRATRCGGASMRMSPKQTTSAITANWSRASERGPAHPRHWWTELDRVVTMLESLGRGRGFLDLS